MTGPAPPPREPLFRVSAPMAPPDGPRTLGGVARVFFAHRSTRLILLSLAPLTAWRVAVGGWSVADAWTALAVAAAWPFFEWIFHVAIHLRPPTVAGRTLDTVAAREHRLHHVDPTIVDHTLLPPSVVVVLAVLSIGGFTLALGPARGGTAAICFHLGGLANGWVHLLSHMPYAPRTRFFRWIRTTHTLHHFKNEGYWFAFTGPFVDVLFRTHRRPTDVETSAACEARHRRGREEG